MKRFIAIILSVVMLSSVLSLSSFAQPYVYDDSYAVGDANNDSRINAVDALTMRLYLANNGNYDLVVNAADINNDGRVNAADVLLLRKILTGAKDVNDYQSEKNVDKFTIAGNDITLYSIVLPEGTEEKENIYYAATQLQKYVEEATGLKLPITFGESSSAYIINFAKVTEGSEMANKLEIENYIYEVVDGKLNIYGTRRGNMYVVYEILEDYLGFRFYSSQYTFLYESRWVDIPEGTYKFVKPTLSFRYDDLSHYFNVEGSKYNGDSIVNHYFPRRMNGTQVYSHDSATYGTLTGPHFINAHSYGYYYRMATGNTNSIKYEDKYASGIQQNESKWNPCSTDDETYQLLFRGLLETMRMIQKWGHVFRPETSSMSFSICDNPYVCPCWYCKQISNESGSAGLNIYLANRAARDITEYYPDRAASWDDGYGDPIEDEYPDMKIYTIIYRHDMPNKVLPEDNLIIMYCGTACNNHYFESGECEGHKNNLGGDGYADVQALKAWGETCKQTGAELWFWYYPVNYNTYLTDSPNIFNIYYDFKYMVEQCNVTGIYYEGGGKTYGFEQLKSHLASKMMWEPDMSYDEFVKLMKEFLWMNYGDGYEDIYEYILMQDAAGNASPCYVNNFDRPGDMFDYYYIRDNYETMRALLTSAFDKADTDERRSKIEKLIVSCDFLGLSANFETYHINGSTEQKQTYVDRYTWMYNYIKNNKMVIFCNDTHVLPPEIELDVKPIISFYEYGSWNEKNKDTWGYEPAPKDGWGYG